MQLSFRLAPTRLLAAAAAWLIGSTMAHAQALPAGVQWGMTTEALRAAVPGLERVSRPQRLTGGLTGTWRAAPEVFGGLPFEPVFFFAAGHLRRVELIFATQAQPDLGAAAFAEILNWGRQTFGPELGSNDPGSTYAAWVQGDTDVYLQFVKDPRRAAVRLVYKSRQLKDDSEL